MTSKLKCPVCPYCDKPLHCIGTQYINKHIVAMWCCQNPECEYSEDLIGTREMWEVFTNARHIFAQGQENTKELATQLIQVKQDLEIATNALKEIKKVCDGCRWCDSNLYDPTPGDGRRIAEITNKALEQITHDNSEKANSVEHKEI